MQIRSGGGTCNWPLKGGARLKEVAATASGTVSIQYKCKFIVLIFKGKSVQTKL